MGVLTILSLIYSAGAIYILWPNLTYVFYFNLNELSKLGGFLSGIFSPLVFLWLIGGYLIQNKEINENIKILTEQTKLQKHTLIKKESDKISKSGLILLRPESEHIDESTIKITSKNIGSSISNIEIHQIVIKGHGVFSTEVSNWNTGEEVEINLKIKVKDKKIEFSKGFFKESYKFEFGYYDTRGIARSLPLHVQKQSTEKGEYSVFSDFSSQTELTDALFKENPWV